MHSKSLSVTFLASLLSLAAAVLAPSLAAAQQPPPPPPAPYGAGPPPGYGPQPAPYYAAPAPRPFPDRRGFTIGFGLGGGVLQDDQGHESDGGVGLSFRLGGAISQRLLLQFDVEATRITAENDTAVQLNFYGIAATAYLIPRVFLTGGLGVAKLGLYDSDNSLVASSDTVGAALIAGGVELYQTSSFALTVEGRIFVGSENGDSLGGENVLVGFQWF